MTENTLTIELLEKLIGFATVSRDSNLALIDWVQTYLEERGFDCHRVLDSTGTKAGLFASIGPGTGGVMLSGHSDVVPIDGQDWSSDPFSLTQRDGRLYGRGTCDMKGFLACALSAADRASRLELREPFKLAISYDEEVGCLGIAHMIDQLQPTIGLPRVCIIGEPTEMKLITEHKGKVTLQARCTGMAGHSSLAPKFINALHLATDLIQTIRTMQDDLRQNGARDDEFPMPYSTLHVGKLSGGSALNIVPDSAVIDFELRHLPQDAPGPIIEELRKSADKIVGEARENHTQADIEIEQSNAYPALQTPADSEIVGWISGFLDQKGNAGKVDFGTEAGHFSKAGVQTVVCGPGSIDQAHKPDEFIEASELRRCDEMLSRILASIAGK